MFYGLLSNRKHVFWKTSSEQLFFKFPSFRVFESSSFQLSEFRLKVFSSFQVFKFPKSSDFRVFKFSCFQLFCVRLKNKDENNWSFLEICIYASFGSEAVAVVFFCCIAGDGGRAS